MNLSKSTALITGANRGLGRSFAAELVAAGATVYGAARNPASVDLQGVIPITMDITDPASVNAAAEATGDVTLLINNAGISTGADLLHGDLASIALEMDTHYFGTLNVMRAFAPQLAKNDGGAILNVLSVLSWLAVPSDGAYCAAKSAEWALTNAVRQQLAGQGTTVTALHVGLMDTDMARAAEGAKANPSTVAALALQAVADGEAEVLADEITRQVQARLAGGVSQLYPSS